MANKVNSVDMIHGPLWGKILKFSFVFMLTAFAQHLYSAADVVIVGRYAGKDAMAGVGTCTVLVNLFVNFIMGFSAGATIVLGQAIGARNSESIGKASHTTIALAIYGGVIISAICLLFTKPLLRLIDVPADVMPQATIYLRITAVGFIPSLIYNFGAGILRAKGDTKRALYIVLISGVINVGLNVLFVCAFKMKASGVALATVISQVFTALMILRILCTESDETRIELKKLRIHKEPFIKIIKLGLPSGIQNSVYSISNMVTQSSVNSFNSAAIAGASAATSITDFYNVMFSSLYQSAIVFTSQNFGAKKFDRIKKVLYICIVYVMVCWGIQIAVTKLFGEALISLYAPSDPEIIKWGMIKFGLMGYTYGLLGFLNVFSGGLRGMGASFINMLTSIVGVCGIRILWIFTAFKAIGTFRSLYWCYPLSWFVTSVIQLVMLIFVFRKCKATATLNNI